GTQVNQNLRYKLLLGKGSFAAVYQSDLYDHSKNVIQVAVKVFHKNRIQTHLYHDKKLTSVEYERELLNDIHQYGPHPNILKYIGCVEPENWLVFEYMPNGTLRAFIKARRNNNNELIPFALQFRFLTDLFKGLAHLHKNKILHRDLKSANLLLDDQYTLKIA